MQYTVVIIVVSTRAAMTSLLKETCAHFVSNLSFYCSSLATDLFGAYVFILRGDHVRVVLAF